MNRLIISYTVLIMAYFLFKFNIDIYLWISNIRLIALFLCPCFLFIFTKKDNNIDKLFKLACKPEMFDQFIKLYDTFNMNVSEIENLIYYVSYI